MSRDWILYLEDILASCRKIRQYTKGMNVEEFKVDEKTYDAVVRNLEIIGEAAKNIPTDIRLMIPEIDWRKPAGLRDVIAHAYFGIDDNIHWDVIQNKVPVLMRAVDVFYRQSRDSGD